MSTKSGDTIGTPIMVRETEEAEWMLDVVSGICTRGCCVVDSHGRFHGPSSEGKYWQYASVVPETVKPIERLDSKVHGTLIKNKDGKEIPADEFIVFRPSDNALEAVTMADTPPLKLAESASNYEDRKVQIKIELARLHDDMDRACRVVNTEIGYLGVTPDSNELFTGIMVELKVEMANLVVMRNNEKKLTEELKTIS